MKFQLLIQKFLLVSLSSILFIACNKGDELPNIPTKEIVPVAPGIYLEEATNLGDVAEETIRITAQIANYPQFCKYMKYSIEIYKIVYHTTYKGQPILASGIISFPTGIADSISTMIVGNGLIFADKDAPSNFNLPTNYTGFEFIASMGYLTLIPDMIGFGVSKDIVFPIHNYEHSAKTMIDFILASEEFIKNRKLLVNNKKFLAGYSQGGYIALATLKMIEENPLYGINIEAATVGAGGFNLVTLFDDAIKKNTYSAPCHLALLLTSYNLIYDWNRPLTDFFREKYARIIPELLNGKYNREEIDNHLICNFDSLLNPTFLNNLRNNNESDLTRALAENSVDDWAPKTKLMIFHSLNDDRIPVSNSEDTYKEMMLNGSKNVKLMTVETYGHLNSGFAFFEIALKWLNSTNR